MATGLLPAGKQTHSSTRQILFAQHVDSNKIIDVVPEAPPNVPPTPASYAARRPSVSQHTGPRSVGPQPTETRPTETRFAETRFAETNAFMSVPPDTFPSPYAPNDRGGIEPVAAAPAKLALDYEKYPQQPQSARHFGFDVNPSDPDNIIVTIYGKRWIIVVIFLAIILIGFSLEKLPVLAPVLWDLFA